MTAPKSRRRQRGEGGIGSYKTQAGERFYVKYRMPAADGLGERQVMRRGFTSRAEAAKALRAALAEIDRGQHIAPSRLTLGAYLTDQWLPSLRLKASTEASYRKNVRLHVIPHLGGVE